MRFSELVSAHRAPSNPCPASRGAVDTDTNEMVMSSDVRNSGYIRSIFDKKRQGRMKASRRNFLRGGAFAITAGSVATLSRLGPAREVEAQSAIVGSFPRRIFVSCPPLAANHNCLPGCGSLPVCTSECCDSSGYFRNDPGAGLTLNPGVCDWGSSEADGWLWQYGSSCGGCDSIEYRCTDGFIRQPSGALWPYICRHVTQCGGVNVPEPSWTLVPGTPPPPLPVTVAPPPAVPTPPPTPPPFTASGAIDVAVDLGGSFRVGGWIKGPTTLPVAYYVTVDGVSPEAGTAGLPRPDLVSVVPGAGTNHGFEMTRTGISPGLHNVCVFAFEGTVVVQIACVDINVTAGGPAAPAPAPVPATAPPPIGGQDPLLPFGVLQIARVEDGKAFVSGFAFDPASDDPIKVVAFIDWVKAKTVTADLPRPEVAASYPNAGPNVGFAFSFPLPEGEHLVCLEAVSANGEDRVVIGCDDLVGPSSGPTPPEPTPDPGPTAEPATTAPGWSHEVGASGAVTTIRAGGPGVVVIEGWLFNTAALSEAAPYEVRVDGVVTHTGRASAPRPDIDRIYGAGPNHGIVDRFQASAGLHRVEVVALDDLGRPSVSIGSGVVEVS